MEMVRRILPGTLFVTHNGSQSELCVIFLNHCVKFSHYAAYWVLIWFSNWGRWWLISLALHISSVSFTHFSLNMRLAFRVLTR